MIGFFALTDLAASDDEHVKSNLCLAFCRLTRYPRNVDYLVQQQFPIRQIFFGERATVHAVDCCAPPCLLTFSLR